MIKNIDFFKLTNDFYIQIFLVKQIVWIINNYYTDKTDDKY